MKRQKKKLNLFIVSVIYHVGRYPNTGLLCQNSAIIWKRRLHWMRCKICCHYPRRKAFQAIRQINHFWMTHRKRPRHFPDRTAFNDKGCKLVSFYLEIQPTVPAASYSACSKLDCHVMLMHNLFNQQFTCRHWRTHSMVASMNNNCEYLMPEASCLLVYYLMEQSQIRKPLK